MKLAKNKRGALAQMIVVIFLAIIAIYLIGDYRVSIGEPSKHLIESGNKQIIEIDKNLNK